MWAFWRVYDTIQVDQSLAGEPALAELPNRAGLTPHAVNSIDLLGKTMPDGRILTTAPTSATDINIDDRVRSFLPPQGDPGPAANWDASVWDWAVNNTTKGPLYLSEPETNLTWANYQSATPGQRLEILFNPNNGRPAFPLLRPHAKRPPFAPGRSGSPYLGDNGNHHFNFTDKYSLIPAGARLINYTVVTEPVSVTLNNKFGITSPNHALLMLDEDKAAILNGTKPTEQLTIRANVGDGVDVTQYNEVTDASKIFPSMSKANIHIHFVQFDTQASDGVITGLSYEQSVRSYLEEGANKTGIHLTQTAPAGSNTITVDDASTLKVNAFVGIGFGVTANSPTGFEFAQIIGKNGNTLTLDRNLAKDHPTGQFAGVEFTRYQWYADFEEGTTYFHNHVFSLIGFEVGTTGALVVEPRNSQWLSPVTGQPVRSGTKVNIITDPAAVPQLAPDIPTQNFREYVLHQMNAIHGTNVAPGPGGDPGGFNLRQEPLANRLAENADPSLVFSSVIHGDPATPLLRAYDGDLVMIRLLNSAGHDANTFHITGQQVRFDRYNANETPKDTITLGISERYDMFLKAGGAGSQSGDYLYMSGSNEKMVDGAWGIIRVHDTLQPDLPPLPGSSPPVGAGFPQNTVTGPLGARPPTASEPNTVADLAAKMALNGYVLPDLPVRTFNVSAINIPIVFSATVNTGSGRAYVLTEDEAAVKAGTKPLEPLVLRANIGEIVKINFKNNLTANPASFHIPQLVKTTDSMGGAIGFDNDSTAAPGASRTLWYVIDPRYEVPRSMAISDFGDPSNGGASGLYGAFIVEPAGSTYSNPVTGAPVNAGAVVKVSGPNGIFTDAALIFHEDDKQMNRDVMPYLANINGLRGINYKAMPFNERDPTHQARVLNSTIFGDPTTLLITVNQSNEVHLHVLQGYGQQVHTFTISGYCYPFEPTQFNALEFYGRVFGPLQGLDATLEGGAGGLGNKPGDFLYRDARNAFLEGGLWGIIRVQGTTTNVTPVPPGGNVTGIVTNTTSKAPILVV